MKFDPQMHHRRSIRLKGYDYTQSGGYFITIVTCQRDLLFGEIINEEMRLNEFGKIANECWRAIPDHFLNVELGVYVVLPNHVQRKHDNKNSPLTVEARHASLLPHGAKPTSIGAIVGSFKSTVSKRIGREHNIIGIWQRNYYEHVIRNHADWDRIHRYIETNPSLWAKDEENPLKT